MMTESQQRQIEEYAKRTALRQITCLTPFGKEGRYYINVKVKLPTPIDLQPHFASAELRDFCKKELQKCKDALRAESTQS